MIKEIAGGYVKTETHNGITTIEFFHPQSNSLPGKILETLAGEIISAGNREETKVLILKSGGEKTFCAGASFDELVQIKDKDTGFLFFSGFAKVINAMRTCPKLIIVRIQGKCVGGGVGLAAAADYSIALHKADVKLSELAIGIGPFVVGPVVERKIGHAAFASLSIDASMWRNSDWAKRKGLFSEVHETLDNLEESVSRLSNTLAGYSPEAMQALKQIIWEGTAHWDKLLFERARISGELILRDFAKKAIEKFKQKSS